MTRSGNSHWPATEIWSVSDERPSLRLISKLRKSEGKFMANSIQFYIGYLIGRIEKISIFFLI